MNEPAINDHCTSIYLVSPITEMPIKATAYRHQVEAFNFVCRLFGLSEGGDVNTSMKERGAALLMEM